MILLGSLKICWTAENQMFPGYHKIMWNDVFSLLKHLKDMKKKSLNILYNIAHIINSELTFFWFTV
jgi:hypothetical protein